jgi:uncharacterized protein YwqG
MIDWVALAATVVFMATLIGLLQWREVRAGWRWWQERPLRAARAREAAENLRTWRAEFEAANPEGPPITPEEHAEFRAWLAAQKRPAVRLTPQPGPAEPDGCRLGGPVWLAEGQDWPLSPHGQPMLFLAQIDFAALPPLPGFPRADVVQVFLPTDDDLFGMHPDDPGLGAGGVSVLARPNGAGAVRHENLPAFDWAKQSSPLRRDEDRLHGVVLAPTACTAQIDSNQWQAEARLEGHRRREGAEKWEDALEAAFTPSWHTHHVGGYPVFSQYDFREPGKHDDYDTCLLHLTSDDHVQWGDVGEANLLIRAQDLAAGDFSRVIFWWDCS